MQKLVVVSVFEVNEERKKVSQPLFVRGEGRLCYDEVVVRKHPLNETKLLGES